MSVDLLAVRPCVPAEATFAAYSVTVSDAAVLDPGKPRVRQTSGALLRALLINAVECGGAIVLDNLTGAVTYTYASGTFDTAVYTARPVPDTRVPECGACGQWLREHGNPNASCCEGFTWFPRPGALGNDLCVTCSQPYRHHGRRYTVACGEYLPEYVDADVARDMARMRAALAEAKVRYSSLPDNKGGLHITTRSGDAFRLRRLSEWDRPYDAPERGWRAASWDTDPMVVTVGPAELDVMVRRLSAL